MTGLSFGLGKGIKPKKQPPSKPVAATAFGAESDDDEGQLGNDAKRRRREPAAGSVLKSRSALRG